MFSLIKINLFFSQGGSSSGGLGSLLDGGKEHESKENNWRDREEKMENGDVTPDNNNTIDKNKNGNISPEPDQHTLYNNGTLISKDHFFFKYQIFQYQGCASGLDVIQGVMMEQSFRSTLLQNMFWMIKAPLKRESKCRLFLSWSYNFKR